MRRNVFRLLSASALIILAVVLPGVAQDRDEGEYYPRTATLNLFFWHEGETQVSFYSPLAIDDAAGVREALNGALHCNLSAPQIPHYTAEQMPDSEQRRRVEQLQTRVVARQLQGTCPTQLQHRGMRSSLDLSLGDVLAHLRANKIETLTVSISYHGLYNLNAAHRRPLSSYSGMVSFQLPVATDDGTIHLDWGYERKDLTSPLVIAGLFILLPCILILWMRSRTLHLHTVDRAGAWFSYIRTQHLCTNAALLLWIGGGYSVRALFENILSAAWGSNSTRAATLSIAYFILPPLLILFVSAVASYRVMVEVRQVSWRFRDFFGLQFAQLGTILIPLLGVYSGIQLIETSPWIGWGTIIAGFSSFPLAVYLRRKLTGRYPEPVTSGEFHDRIFLLARRAGVTLKGIFLLPSGRLPVANAFATGNGIVMVTDYILQKLNRREVEAVAAHELGHLQYKHPKKLGLAILGIILLPMIVRSVFPTFFYSISTFFPTRTYVGPWGTSDGLGYPSLDFLVATLCLLTFYAMSRRFERIADQRSVTLTDDPEALITAFAKLSLINLTPLQWGRGSEALITHPSTLKRIHRIARLGNVSEERVQALVANPNAHDEPNEPVSTFESPRPATEFVYPAREQLQRAQINLLLLIAVSMGLPTLFAYIAEKSGADAKVLCSILLGGVFVTFAVYLITYRWRAVGSRSMLRKRFEVHFRRLYPTLDLSRAHLVGYSPDPWPRFYYVQPYWDIGLLIPAREGLVYLGDQAKFLLPHSSIRECVFANGIPAWKKLQRTYIRWEHEGAHGVMNFASLDPCPPLRIESVTLELNKSISEFHERSASMPSVPSECAGLALPAAVQLKSKTPHEAYPFRSVVKLTLFAMIPGGLLTNAFLLPNILTGMIPMFYVPGVMLVLRFLEWLPYARYKDRLLSPEWTVSSKVVENRATTSS